jgi:hypothetical protein
VFRVSKRELLRLANVECPGTGTFFLLWVCFLAMCFDGDARSVRSFFVSEYSDVRAAWMRGFVRENRVLFGLACQSTLTTLLHELARGMRRLARGARRENKNEVTELLRVHTTLKSFVRGKRGLSCGGCNRAVT